ncbi:MAG TPA: hypothetical protein VFC39_18340, partial [Acidobacteriaceae bacterium]|nr:hypothetical protein [Acidobacteriaceae bacterium]
MNRFHSVTRSVLLFAFTLTATVPAFADGGPKKTSPDLAHPTTSTVSVIVQYNTPPTASLLQRLTALTGPIAPVLLKTINAVHLSLPVSSLASIAADSNVKYISLDRAVRSHG